MRNNFITAAARKFYGGGKQAEAFIHGMSYADENPEHENINQLARESYNSAIIRGKTTKTPNHEENFFSIFEEFKELKEASEHDHSEHLPRYSEAAEELADIIIACLTELHSRDVDVECLLRDKINFNKTRQ